MSGECVNVVAGRVVGVALFETGTCFDPVYETDAGWFDDCATILDVSPETEDTREEVLVTCPSGDIIGFEPGRTVTKYVEWTLGFRQLPTEFLGALGALNVHSSGGVTDCENPVDLTVVVWQKNIAKAACGDDSGAAPYVARLLAFSEARFSQDGDFGSSDFQYTLIGRSVSANLQSGPMPILDDGTGTAVYPTECWETCPSGYWDIPAAPPPSACGYLSPVAPAEPCSPATS